MSPGLDCLFGGWFHCSGRLTVARRRCSHLTMWIWGVERGMGERKVKVRHEGEI